MDIEKYKKYNIEDFVLDEDFVNLAKGRIVDDNSLDDLKNKLPEKNKEIAFAAKLISGLQTSKVIVPVEHKVSLLNLVFKSKGNYIRLSFFRYAAAIFVFAALGISLAIYFVTRPEDIENFALLNQVDSRKAELILADGKRVEIESKQSRIEYNADGTSVSLNDSSKLEQSRSVLKESYNQVIVPFGKRSTILLSDGSKVWLNSGSRLIYPPVFNGKKREVFLDGEAYFEVSKNKDKPFFVRTNEFNVKVLGTKFLIQAFEKEAEYNALLVEGSVCLTLKNALTSRDKYLQPNQYAKFSKTEKNFKITTVENPDNYIDWINGYMSFTDEDIADIASRISRYYNIKIVVNAKDVKTKFSGKLDLKDEPERIISGLSTITKTKYEKQGDCFVILE